MDKTPLTINSQSSTLEPIMFYYI